MPSRPPSGLSPAALVLTAVLLVGALWGVLVFEVERSYRETSAAASTNVANLALAAEKHVSSIIRDVDHSLLLLRDEWLDDHADFLKKATILGSAYQSDILVQIGIIGPDGRFAASNLAGVTDSAEVNGREYFAFHRDHIQDTLRVSPPLRGRVTGLWSLRFTRRITNRDGSFGGVIVISIDPEHLSRFYQEADLGNHGFIALVGLDGIIRARGGMASDLRIGKQVGPGRPYLEPNAPLVGGYRAQSVTGSGTYLAAYRRLAEYPLVVVVALGESEVFAAHNERRTSLFVGGGGLTLLIMLGTALLMRATRANRRYQIALADDARRLAGQRQRLAIVNRSLRLLNDIAALGGSNAREKLKSALNLGAEHFGLELGVLSRVTGDDFTVEHCFAPPGHAVAPGAVFDLENTFCAATLNTRNVLALGDVAASPLADHPSRKAFGLGAYIGVPLSVQGQPYGTICFASPSAYAGEFDDQDFEFMRLLSRWAGQVLNEERVNQELHRLATTDSLTGVLTRRHFLELAGREFQRARRYGHHLSLLMIDVDHFKRINDTYGHQIGDEVLIALASVAQSALRDSDVFGRLGGEEFAVLLTDTDGKGARDLAERLREAVSKVQVPIRGTMLDFVGLTVSVGVTEVTDSDSLDVLLHRADLALYDSKKSGRNRVTWVAAPR